jgi:protocatechuate 3,4-dioxygenase beta subunit
MPPTRRDVLAALVATPLAAATAVGQDAPLPLTPVCDDGDDPTPAQTEGPYFTPNSPEKRDFAADAPDGARVTLTGFALDRSCRPLPGALIELWHCDAAGVYDNAGFRLRGHQFADASGLWRFDTIAPGLYPGRTRHFHLKAQARGGRVLTTQLYFPGEPGNVRDRIFDDRLLVDLVARDDARIARFDLVLG